MGHPQNSPRGLFAKMGVRIGTAGKVYFDSYASTALLTANSSGLLVAGTVKVGSNANSLITGDANGVVVKGGVKISQCQPYHGQQYSRYADQSRYRTEHTTARRGCLLDQLHQPRSDGVVYRYDLAVSETNGYCTINLIGQVYSSHLPAPG